MGRRTAQVWSAPSIRASHASSPLPRRASLASRPPDISLSHIPGGGNYGVAPRPRPTPHSASARVECYVPKRGQNRGRLTPLPGSCTRCWTTDSSRRICPPPVRRLCAAAAMSPESHPVPDPCRRRESGQGHREAQMICRALQPSILAGGAERGSPRQSAHKPSAAGRYPPAEAVRWASSQGVDLVVAASHQGIFHRMVLGSFAGYLAYHAKCLVMLIPPSMANAGDPRVDRARRRRIEREACMGAARLPRGCGPPAPS